MLLSSHVDCSAARRRPGRGTDHQPRASPSRRSRASPTRRAKARAPLSRSTPMSALAEADFSDRLRKGGVRRSPVDGLPVSLKDLFDVAGDVTRAGSKILQPESRHRCACRGAAARRGRGVRRPHQHGRVRVRHHRASTRITARRRIRGTARPAASRAARPPARRWRRPTACASMALGSDTRGSMPHPGRALRRHRLQADRAARAARRRIPAFLHARLGRAARQFGRLLRGVRRDARRRSGRAAARAAGEGPAGCSCRKTEVREGLDREVAQAFDASVERLRREGAGYPEKPVPAFDRQGRVLQGRRLCRRRGLRHSSPERRAAVGEYDPRVAKRVMLGKDLSAADYVDFGLMRAAVPARGRARSWRPSTLFCCRPCPASRRRSPRSNASDEAYFRWNMRILRIVGLVNFLDGCAVSLPCHARGAAPVGLMVCGPAMSDRRILAVAAAVEGALAQRLTARTARRRFERAAATYAEASRLEARGRPRACSSASTT